MPTRDCDAVSPCFRATQACARLLPVCRLIFASGRNIAEQRVQKRNGDHVEASMSDAGQIALRRTRPHRRSILRQRRRCSTGGFEEIGRVNDRLFHCRRPAHLQMRPRQSSGSRWRARAMLRLSTTAYVHTVFASKGRHRSTAALDGASRRRAVGVCAAYHEQNAMLQTPLGQQYPSAVFATAGLISDVVGVLLWVPADVVSQRVQMLSVADGAASTTPQIASAQPQHAAIGAEGASAAISSSSSSSSMDPWGRRPLRALRDLSAFPAATPPPPPTTIASTSRPSRVPMLSSGGGGEDGPSFYATLQPPSGIEIAWRICMREGAWIVARHVCDHAEPGAQLCVMVAHARGVETTYQQMASKTGG